MEKPGREFKVIREAPPVDPIEQRDRSGAAQRQHAKSFTT
jgi:hypothetical protein